VFFFLIALALSPTTLALTIGQSTQVRGSVADAIGVPLANVTVTLRSRTDARVVQTGPDGAFEFSQLPGGDFELSATLAGFAPARRTLRLEPGETKTVSLTLSVLLVEQMLVTAAKTGERDADATPIAMSVVTARELEQARAHTIEDIVRLAPSVAFSQNTGFAQLTIRGIGTNAIFTGSDTSSAVYLDGVYLARPAMVLGDFLDVERIEVLRGPQGALYGRNAVGGALNVITRVPTNELHGSLRFVAGNQGTFRGYAHLSGPLVPGRMMGSIAVVRGTARGFVRDIDHPEHPLGGEDVTAALAKLRIFPHRRSEMLLSADVTHQAPTPLTYAKVLAVKPGFHIDNPADLHDVRTSALAESRKLQYGASLRAVVQLTPGTTASSLTAFRKLDYDVLVDTDITELDLTVSHVREIHHQVSEELTLSHQQGRLNLLGGLFLFDDADRQPTSIWLGGPRLENRLNPAVQTDSTAVFGQASIGLTNNLSLTAGLRYTREDKTMDNQGELYTLDVPVSLLAGSAYAYADVISYRAWTPRVALELGHDAETFTYLSATRGFKSGGFNISATDPGLAFAPEWAWSYEAGLKTVIGRRARIATAGFYTDYSNLQVQTAIRPGVLDISNAAAATIKGLEFESAAQVARGLRIGGYLNWLSTRYDRYTAVGVGGITGDAAGHRLNNAPVWSGRGWLEWSHAMWRASTLSIRPDVSWQTTTYFTPFNDSIQRQPSYALLNVSAEIRPRRGFWVVTLYARNASNRDYITGTFGSPPPAIGGRPGAPRQVGITFSLQR
jgi:iron complex outermembrane receptor protein